MPFEINLWQAQNIWYEILRTSALEALDDEQRARWNRDFKDLGCCLSIDCETIVAEVNSVVETSD
jgi:hypothetical protein